jgi:hypothetical protein
MTRIEEIHKKMPNTHLVMHGSSSVPQELQDIINKYGGKMKQTWGVPVEEIQRGIKHGVRKINVDTDNRLAITGAIRKVFAETPEKFDPRDYLKPARDAMKKVCKDRMIAFGQAGNARSLRLCLSPTRSFGGLPWKSTPLKLALQRPRPKLCFGTPCRERSCTAVENALQPQFPRRLLRRELPQFVERRKAHAFGVLRVDE